MPQRPTDMYAVTLEVDVGPLQSKELTLTHPGEHGREEQRLERLILRLEKAPNFLRGQDLDFDLFATGKLDVLGRIRVEVAPLDCVLEHLLEDQDHVADRCRSEALAEQDLDELPDEGQGDVSQQHCPEKRQDVLGQML